MPKTGNSHSELQAIDAAIAKLSGELNAQAAKGSEAAREKLAALRAQRDVKRLEITSQIGASIASTQVQLAKAEGEAAAASGDSKRAAQARIFELQAEIAKLRQELRAYVASVTLATGEEIAMLESKAKVAQGAAKDKAATYGKQLRERRDAFERAAANFADAAGAKVERARSDFTQSMKDLVAARSEGSPPPM
jgi:hypothetical protein